MALATPSVFVPIHTDEQGTIRIADTRVTLDVVIARFQQQRTPEQIQESFPTLKLADIYAVITYYLNNRDKIDAHLRQQAEAEARLREEIEAKQPQSAELRARLLAKVNQTDQD